MKKIKSNFKSIPTWARLVLGLVVLIYLGACLGIGYHYDIDFIIFHRVGEMFWTTLEQIYQQRNGGGGFFYSPLFALFMAPLGLVSFSTAKLLWLCVLLVSLILFWWGSFKLWSRAGTPGENFTWILAVLFLFGINPIHNNFQSNNIGLILLVALVWAEVFSGEDGKMKQIFAALLVSLAVVIKVFPAFIWVYYFLARKHLRMNLAFAVLFWLAVPFIVMGPSMGFYLYKEFGLSLTVYHHDNSLIDRADLLCLPSLLTRLFIGIGITATVAQKCALVVSMSFGAMIMFFARHFGGRDPLCTWALVLATMAFINPSSLAHYGVFYIPLAAAATYLFLSGRLNGFLKFGLAAAFAMILLTVDWVIGKRMNDTLELLSIPTLGYMFLIVTVATALWRQGSVDLTKH